MNDRKLFLGFTNNIDYEVILSIDTLSQLILDYDIRQEDLHNYSSIYNIKELISFTLYCMKNNIGVEKFVNVSTILNDFACFFKYNVTIGGTAARAALAMSMIGCADQIYLHLRSVNQIVEDLLPKNIDFITSTQDNTIYPHVIIQYNYNDTISINDIFISPKYSNRIIYTNDPYSKVLNINDHLFDAMHLAKAVLISGFNAVDSKIEFINIINYISNKLRGIKPKPLFFYENACFYNLDFNYILNDTLGDVIDIYSLNEDEFENQTGIVLDLLNPEIVFESLKKFKKRIFHVRYILLHTKYWALLYGNNANKFYKCLQSAICLASTRALYGDNYSRIEYSCVEKMTRNLESIRFSNQIKLLSNEEILCIPSYDIIDKKLTTIGLGDSFVGGFFTNLI